MPSITNHVPLVIDYIRASFASDLFEKATLRVVFNVRLVKRRTYFIVGREDSDAEAEVHFDDVDELFYGFWAQIVILDRNCKHRSF